MTQHEIVHRLGHHDPAPPDEPPPDLGEELRRILAIAREERGAPRHTRRRLAVAAACAGVVAAGVVVGVDGSPGPDLAARAYAAVAVQDEVVHTVRRITTIGEPAAVARPTLTTEVERWQRGADLRIVIRDQAGGIVEQVLNRGKLTITLPDGTVQRSGEGELAEPLSDIAGLIGVDPVTDFRTAYAQDGLKEAGPTTFAGREAVSYALPERRERVAGAELTTTREFLVDAATGAPLGSRYAQASAGRADAPDDRYATTTVIERFERLEPTPDNLALLASQR